MKTSDLKRLLKPLIQEMVKESLKESVKDIILEGGLLSQVITEVMKGIGPTTIVESKKYSQVQQPRQTTQPRQNFVQQRYEEEQIEEDEVSHLGRVAKMSEREKSKIQETKKRLLDGVGASAYNGVNIFEGIREVIPDEVSSTPGVNPLSGMSPNDPGVDIESLFDKNKMSAILNGLNKRK